MSEASVEIEMEATKEEARAIADALGPESKYGRAPFKIIVTRKGLTLKVSRRSLRDARAFANSVLRLLKAARESIQAVE